MPYTFSGGCFQLDIMERKLVQRSARKQPSLRPHKPTQLAQRRLRPRSRATHGHPARRRSLATQKPQEALNTSGLQVQACHSRLCSPQLRPVKRLQNASPLSELSQSTFFTRPREAKTRLARPKICRKLSGSWLPLSRVGSARCSPASRLRRGSASPHAFVETIEPALMITQSVLNVRKSEKSLPVTSVFSQQAHINN